MVKIRNLFVAALLTSGIAFSAHAQTAATPNVVGAVNGSGASVNGAINFNNTSSFASQAGSGSQFQTNFSQAANHGGNTTIFSSTGYGSNSSGVDSTGTSFSNSSHQNFTKMDNPNGMAVSGETLSGADGNSSFTTKTDLSGSLGVNAFSGKGSEAFTTNTDGLSAADLAGKLTNSGTTTGTGTSTGTGTTGTGSTGVAGNIVWSSGGYDLINTGDNIWTSADQNDIQNTMTNRVGQDLTGFN